MARHETLAHAKARMRREGWSEAAIRGQANRWRTQRLGVPKPVVSLPVATVPRPTVKVPSPHADTGFRAVSIPRPTGDPHVRSVQRRLNAAGYNVDVDGVLGPQTRAAISRHNKELPGRQAAANQAFANTVRTQYTEPVPKVDSPHRRRIAARGLPVPRSSGGSALGKYEPHDPYALGNIPGLRPRRQFAPTPDLRTPFDKQVGNIVGSIISDPLGALAFGKAGVHFVKHPSIGAGTAAAAAGLGVVPVLRGPRAAAAMFTALRDGAALREAAQAGARSFGERGPIATARETLKLKRMKADVMPVLKNDPVRRVIFQEIDAAGLEPGRAKQLKSDLDAAAAEHADTLARGVKGGTLANRRAIHAPAYFHDMHSTAAKLHGSIPDFIHQISKEEADAHLRSFLDPKNIAKGHAQNPARASTHPDLGALVATGRITPEQWWARTQHAFNYNQADGLKAAYWYRQLGPIFYHFFGDDAPAILRGFAVSQANASPSGGLQAVLEVRDLLLRGQPVPEDKISTVVKSIEAAYQGQPVTAGMAAKLHDFANSLEGKSTRTWTGDDIRGGAPTAIDIHAQRDLGRIDPKILATLRDRHGLPVAHLQLEALNRELKRLQGTDVIELNSRTKIRKGAEGFEEAKANVLRRQRGRIRSFKKANGDEIKAGRKSGLKLDNPGAAASGINYDQPLREYAAITRYLNDNKAWGKTWGTNEWTPAEVQALGWSGIQRFHGEVPEDALAAIERNTHHISLEVLSGANDFAKAPASYRAALGLTKREQANVLRIIGEENGILRAVDYGPGIYQNVFTPSMNLQILGSPNQVDRIAARLAREYQQWEVWATRPGLQSSVKGRKSKFAIELEAPQFAKVSEIRRYWADLQAHATPKQLKQLTGATTYSYKNEAGETVYGLRIVTGHASGKEEKIKDFLRRNYGELLEGVNKRSGYHVKVDPNNVEVRIHEGQPAGTAEAGRVYDLGGHEAPGPPGEPAVHPYSAEAAGALGPARPAVSAAVPGLDVPHPGDAFPLRDEYGNVVPSARFVSGAEEPFTFPAHWTDTGAGPGLGEVYDDARSWLADVAWSNMEPEQMQALPDAVVANAIDKYYDGGMEQFISDSLYVDPLAPAAENIKNVPEVFRLERPLYDNGSTLADRHLTEEARAWQNKLRDEFGNPVPSARFATGAAEIPPTEINPAVRAALDDPYVAREMSIGGLTAQFLKPRSGLSRFGVHWIDEASKALDRSPLVHSLPGVRHVTSSERVMKAAGREQRAAQEERLSRMAGAIRTIGNLKEGSAEDVAHFWYAQLPKSHRNAEGLQAVMDLQTGHLRELLDGTIDARLDARETELKETAKLAETKGEVMEIYDELGRLNLYRQDLPFQKEDVSASIAVMKDLVANAPEVDDKVIGAMRKLAEDRKRIMVEGGRLEEGRAAGREGLLARQLGLEEDGSEVYVGHRLAEPDPQGAYTPPSGGTGRPRSPKGAGSRNQLILARNGRLRATTRVNYEDWSSSQVFQQAIIDRTNLGQTGPRWTGGAVPADSLLVNMKGEVIPKHWRSDELAQFTDDAVEREEIRKKADDIVKGFIAQTHDEQVAMIAKVRQMSIEAGKPVGDIRVVKRAHVDRYYKQFRPPGARGEALKTYDHIIDGVSTSIIFARIGYIPKNAVQNLIMAAPHQGVFLPQNLVRAAQVLNDAQFRDMKELKDLLKGQVSSSGGTAAMGKEMVAGKVHRVVTGTVTAFADDPGRIAAFLHEAANEGVIPRYGVLLSTKDKRALIDFLTNPRHERQRFDVRRRAVEAMGDFTRMTPSQARWARRYFIIPGWLVAGSRYPFHFAATHPIRTALIAYALAGEPGAPKELQFNQPVTQYLHGDKYMIGFDTRWGRLRVASLNPISTPEELALAAAGSFSGKKNAYDYQTPTMFDVANPLGAAILKVARGEANLRTYKGWEKAVIAPLVPNYSLIRDLITKQAHSPHYPDDNTWWRRLERELGILPIRVIDQPVRGGTAGPLYGGGGSNLAPGLGGGSGGAPGVGSSSGSFPGGGGGGGSAPGL